ATSTESGTIVDRDVEASRMTPASTGAIEDGSDDWCALGAKRGRKSSSA
ncbi:MAG: hypothetical protein RJA33_1297, partial [Actinomycetota bacterium]